MLYVRYTLHYRVEWIGLNFYDYHVFQPKITQLEKNWGGSVFARIASLFKRKPISIWQKLSPRLNKTATFSFLFEYGGRKKEGSYLHAKAIFIHRVDITEGSSAKFPKSLRSTNSKIRLCTLVGFWAAQKNYLKSPTLGSYDLCFLNFAYCKEKLSQLC